VGRHPPVLAPGLLLATAGVVVTAALVGTAAWWLLGTYTSFEIGSQGLSWPEALLLGVIVSSTDAAALFALFRGGAPLPRPRIRNLLELESGTNDPTAVILTTTLLGLLTATSGGPGATLLTLTLQIVLGTVSGYTLGWAGAALANRLNMQAPGLYPILVLALGLVTFGLSDRLGANPFLAV
jgi:cell volume regulation protein A